MTARLDFIGIVVGDMARSLAFYRHLGLDLPAEVDKEPHVEANLGGGMRLAWDTEETIRSFDPGWTPPSSGQRIGLAFQLDTSAGVDTLYAELVALGYEGHKAPWDAEWGQRYAQIRDPDGISVDLYAALDGTS